MAQTFAYKVRDRAGKGSAGQMVAESRETVVENLRQNGYVVTMVEPVMAAKSAGEVLAGWSQVTAKDLAVTCRQFATMVGAGLPLLKCLSVLIEQTSRRRLRDALETVRRDVENGSALSKSMARQETVFPAIMVAMVRAGETAGILDETLDRLADHFESEAELREKVKNASSYPLIVCVIAVLVVIVMMTFVLPTFKSMLSSLGVELPLPTKVLMNSANFVQEYVIFISIAFVLMVVGVVRYIRAPEGKRKYDRFILKIPVIRDVILKISTARLCRTLGTLVQSGVPILQALDVAEATTGNSVIIEGLDKAKNSIREGEGLARPLAATGVFNPMVTQMIAVGEETGSLDRMLGKVADFYEKEVKMTVDNLSALIEPMLVIFLGLVVGGMIVSILLPLLRIYETVGK